MIYLDHHATTPCDRRVVEAMLPWLTEHFGNPHSTSHEIGRVAADAMQAAINDLAAHLDVPADNVVITSGATESNLLAIRGVLCHPRQQRRKLITVVTEHPSVLDVAKEIQADGFHVTFVGVDDQGLVDQQQLASELDGDTALVSVMWANNEIGTIADIQAIASLVHQHGALLHSDATQAVGRIAVHARRDDVDLISGSAHKFYGPKGVGFLTVGNGNRRVRIRPIQVGGGQQRGRRGGTMNPSSVIAMATALRLACDEMQAESEVRELRDLLWQTLSQQIDGLKINGPPLDSDRRLVGNLNVMVADVEGVAWMAATPEVAFSSGSACSSVDPSPSHVLTALGHSESQARRSVRFGIGRGNTKDEIRHAADLLVKSYKRLSG
ncbi:cysteine desulfurase family protein [Crateriforma conspicua]|uniref:cysteine desulfurase n=1 Tax=Crateriforma conspicua TaxID=2527996 RepID=A0A5C5Y5L3_9PLAN|nr:cysteine desulfurase family protein [Crateriforma conspicua]TWT70219.1 Cysteine desulfurase [Crateriforma conspicua]